jgi:hypothetical protein
LRIIVGAAVSRRPPSPGTIWNWLHWLLGLELLGHDVHLVEEVERGTRAEETAFERVVVELRLQGKACQLRRDGALGLTRERIARVAREADLLINMSGHVRSELVLGNAKRLVYIDQDPVYTQLWQAAYGVDLDFARYHAFVSVGLDIGTPGSPIPDCGVRWRHTLPPVVLERWPVANGASPKRFTTIASWTVTNLRHRGSWYRSKSHEFKRFRALPELVDQELELALDRSPAREPEIAALARAGWHVRDATRIRDLRGYQRYLARSRAEIGIAKHAYVEGRSGWFSDRSAHYLASGRPVVAQSTGFERHLPAGMGLLSFATLDEAVAGIEAINAAYEAHCRAAREIAEEHLDHRKVLPSVLEACAG